MNIKITRNAILTTLLLLVAWCLVSCGPTDSDSDDDDGSIVFTNIAPPGGVVSSIAFHPTDPNIIYAGIDDGGGLFVSSDKGQTWSNVDTGKQNWAAWSVAIDPDDPLTITTVDCYGRGVLRTEDGGVTWAEKNTGLTAQDPDRMIRSLVLNPSNPDILYIGTGAGVYKSTDGADSWTLSSNGLPGTMVYKLTINPDISSNIIALVDGGGIYRTTDSGANWSLVADIIPSKNTGEPWDLVSAPSSSNYVLATAFDRVYLSTDGGLVWNQIAVGEFDSLGGDGRGITAAFDPTDEQTIYLGTFRINGNNIRLRSTDGGTTFSDISGSLGHEGVFRIRVSPHDPNLIIAGMVGDGIEYSVDGGTTWMRHSGPPWMTTAPGSFAQSPSDPQRIYMHGTYAVGRTSDSGLNWDRPIAPTSFSYYMAVHPSDPDILLLSPLFRLQNPGVWRSTDGGDSWNLRPMNGVNPSQITFDSFNPNVVYASTLWSQSNNFGVYRSDNSGEDWYLLTPSSWFNNLMPSGVIEHPDKDGKLLVTTIAGLWQSTADQTVFNQIALNNYNLYMVDTLPGLWVVGGEDVCFIKDGDDWIQHDFPGSNVYTVLLDPDRPNRVLIGLSAWDKGFTSESVTGLYVSDNRGRTFTNITEDLRPADQIYHLQLDHSLADTYLFSQYSGSGGLFRVTIP